MRGEEVAMYIVAGVFIVAADSLRSTVDTLTVDS